jgi:hypothetical protein
MVSHPMPILWEAQLVSTDHYRHELLAQLGRAAKQGHINVLINSGELCRGLRTFTGPPDWPLAAMPCRTKFGSVMSYCSKGPTVQE